jgi:histidinol-phosphate phosphatase family protein
MATGRRAVVLLDRDDTIIADRGYLCQPAGVELLPNAAAGLRRLAELGCAVVVVTNQSGIGRGYFDEAALAAIHARLGELVTAAGGRIDAIYHCPHRPDQGCACRKPAIGMFTRAAAELDFDLRESFVVGDQPLDVEAGRRCGATTILVARADAGSGAAADHVVADLVQAAAVVERALLARAAASGGVPARAARG